MSANGLFNSARPAQDLGLGLLGQLTTGTAQLVDGASPLRGIIAQMLGVYSSAMLVIAGFIILYYFVITIVDAAQTGKLFRRINPIWAPVRLSLAIALLMPLPMSGAAGMNSGQLLVVQVAKWGSGLASQLWSMATRDSATMRPMIASPQPVPALALVRALVLRDACINYTNLLATQLSAQALRAQKAAQQENPDSEAAKRPATVSLQTVSEMSRSTNADGSVTLPYGWSDRPYFCGAVTTYPASEERDAPAFFMIKRAHLDALRQLEMRTGAYATDFINVLNGQEKLGSRNPASMAELYEEIMRSSLAKPLGTALDVQLDNARQVLGSQGWVAAPAYLDTILRLNVRLLSLNASLPQVDLPELLLSPPARPADPNQPTAEWKLYQVLLKIDQSWGEAPRMPPLSAAGLGGLSTLLSQAVSVTREVTGPGATGHQLRAARDLMRTNDYDWSRFASTNPLVGLAELGAYLTGKSAELLAGAGVLNNVGPVTGPTVTLITGLGIVAFITSTALLLLVPLLPLVRFMLGLAIWLVEVFEALIAIPLVALTHLRADENGIAGQSTVMCYLIILKVALRPVLMVFGLLGGLVIFLLMLAALNLLLGGTMPVVVDSGQIASLWFVLLSAVYAVLVAGIANAAFKLIDWLPQRTLTWLQGVALPGSAARPNPTEPPSPTS